MKPTTQIIFSAILSAIILFFLFYIITVNRDSDKTTSILIKAVLGPLLLALVLIFTEIYSPLPSDKWEVQVVIPLDSDNQLVPLDSVLLPDGSPFGGGFNYIRLVLMELHKSQLVQDRPALSAEPNSGNTPELEQHDLALDILEITFWRWLSFNYRNHWNVKHNRFQGISFQHGSMDVSQDAEPNPSIYTAEQISRLLRDNEVFRSKLDLLAMRQVSFPRGSTVKAQRKPWESEIIISNSNLTLSISFKTVAGGGVGNSNLARRIREHLSLSMMYSYHIIVSFKCEYNHWRRWSPSTTQQRKWVQDLVDAFRSDFDWQFIREDLKRVLSEK